MREVHVVGIRVSDEQAAGEEPKPRAVLILREAVGARRYLPVAIGNAEATAVVLEQEGVTPVEPLTHDLINNLLVALGHPLLEVRITDFRDGTFKSDLIFHGARRVPARVSDAVNVAMRARAPIYVDEQLLDEVALVEHSETAE